MVNENGTHEVRITDPNETMSAPAWAPDGRHVLRDRVSGVRGIYIVNPDGTDLTQVTAPPPGWEDFGPVALGNAIVVVRNDTVGHQAIYRVNVAGTGLTRLTPGPRDDNVLASPNGDFIVFAGTETSIGATCVRGPTCA
jgi:Tol biopolymer transport system component